MTGANEKAIFFELATLVTTPESRATVGLSLSFRIPASCGMRNPLHHCQSFRKMKIERYQRKRFCCIQPYAVNNSFIFNALNQINRNPLHTAVCI